jgi:hypothetical protein
VASIRLDAELSTSTDRPDIRILPERQSQRIRPSSWSCRTRMTPALSPPDVARRRRERASAVAARHEA